MALLLSRGFLNQSSQSSLIGVQNILLQGQLGSSADFATLRDIKVRIKAVSSIKKITKSMKMVASSKLKKAQEKIGCC